MKKDIKKDIKGAFVSKGLVTPVKNIPAIAFLFSRSKGIEEDYTPKTPHLSWKETGRPIRMGNPGDENALMCVPVFSNLGDFATASNCLNDIRKPEIKDPKDGDERMRDIPTDRRIRAFYHIEPAPHNNFVASSPAEYFEIMEGGYNVSSLGGSIGEITDINSLDKIFTPVKGDYGWIVNADAGVSSSFVAIAPSHFFAIDTHESFFTAPVSPPEDLFGYIGFYGHVRNWRSENYNWLKKNTEKLPIGYFWSAGTNGYIGYLTDYPGDPVKNILELHPHSLGDNVGSNAYPGDVIKFEVRYSEEEWQKLYGYMYFQLTNSPASSTGNWECIGIRTVNTPEGYSQKSFYYNTWKAQRNSEIWNNFFLDGSTSVSLGQGLPSTLENPNDYRINFSQNHTSQYWIDILSSSVLKDSGGFSVKTDEYTWGAGGGSELYTGDKSSVECGGIVGNGFLKPDNMAVTGAPYITFRSSPYTVGTGQNTDGGLFVCFEGDALKLPQFEAYLRQLASYWGLSQNITFFELKNRFGCMPKGEGNTGEGGDSPFDPPQSSSVFKPTTTYYRGYKEKIFLSYQEQIEGRVEVREIDLDIEFATQVSKIKFEREEYYTHYWVEDVEPVTWQVWHDASLCEQFIGRCEIVGNSIYIAICYAPLRKWTDDGKRMFSPPFRDDAVSFRYEAGINLPINFPYSYPSIGDNGVYPYSGKLSHLQFKETSQPLKDYWSRIIAVKIDKKSLKEEERVEYTYPEDPVLLSPAFALYHFVKGYVLRDYRSTISFIHENPKLRDERFEEFKAGDGVEYPVIIENQEKIQGFNGNPIVYPQIVNDAQIINQEFSSTGYYFYSTDDPFDFFNEFLVQRSYWNNIDYLYWELIGRPTRAINAQTTSGSGLPLLRPIQYQTLIFEHDKFSLHGRNKDYPLEYLYNNFNNTEGVEIRGLREDYLDAMIEYERLRGSGLFEGNELKYWLRIADLNFPWFEPYIRVE